MNGEIINNLLRRIIYYPLLLFRIPNIIIVALTVWVFSTHIVYPRLLSSDILPILSMKDLYLLVFIIGCIAAGGYLLNDIIDIETDKANQKRAFINTGLERLIGFISYGIITVAPIPFSYSLASEIDKVAYMPLYFIVVITLALYNLYLKNIPLIGNLVVALLCAAVIWVFLLAEQESLIKISELDPEAYQFIISMSIFYYVFAFCTNLSREIIKDIQDLYGDKEVGALTLPIAIGINRSRHIVIFIILILSAFLIWWLSTVTMSTAMILSVMILLIAPMSFLIYSLSKCDEYSNYSSISKAFKVWMVLGLIFLYCNS